VRSQKQQKAQVLHAPQNKKKFALRKKIRNKKQENRFPLSWE
jgi:hypothetical protein